jgi:hypothetical protein
LPARQHLTNIQHELVYETEGWKSIPSNHPAHIHSQRTSLVACGILQKENSPNQSFAKLAMSVANPCAISCEAEYLRFLRSRISEVLAKQNI